MEFDLVIRGGLVVDGSGAEGRRADVAVVGDRIAEIGAVEGSGREEIDADGLVVAPGFVDGHTHMDAQVFWDDLGTSSCWQGVTTIAMGNCGYTLSPVRPEDRDLVARNIERAEDIPATALAQGVPWTWSTFAEHLDVLDGMKKGVNYAQSIGHSALRIWAMGERAYDGEPHEGAATEDDLAAMRSHLRDALRAGAIGFTTNRTPTHTTSDGRPVASVFASWDEVADLVTIMAQESTASFQIGMGGNAVDGGRLAVLRRLQELTLSTGVHIATSCHDPEVLGMVTETAGRGGHLFGLTNCRDFNILQSFKTQLSFDLVPEWREVRSQPLEAQRQLLRDPEVRARLVHAAHHGEYIRVKPADPKKPDFSKIHIMYSPYLPNPTVADEAARRGVDPVELMIDLSLEHDFDLFFMQLFFDPHSDEETLTELRAPNTAMTFTDAGAHISQLADASLQTHLLAYWVRERQEITLEQAVAMIAREPAKIWHLHDRGLLAPGFAADVTIFDPDTVAPLVPEVINDLPGGEKRIEQRAQGYVATIVNGQVFTRDGEATETRAGRLLRGGQIAVPAATG